MKRILATIVGALAVIAVACGIGLYVYTSDYYHADATALESAKSATVDGHGHMAFLPEGASPGSQINAAIVFYPGAKVEASAYAPLGKACAQAGYAFVICPMPLNLALLDMDAANQVYAEYPNVQKWYVAGHSLGGLVSLNYAANNVEKLAGAICLAGYTPFDISKSGLSVLSIRGDKDGLTTPAKFIQNRPNLPKDALDVVIPGGNHAGFGSYGAQEGDGVATISQEEQVRQTVEAISAFIG